MMKYLLTFRQYPIVLNGWLKSRTPREQSVFHDMFDKSFQALYTWETQNLQLKMEVLQCNIVQQMLFILEGSVPQTKVEQQEVEMSVHESMEGRLHNFTCKCHPIFVLKHASIPKQMKMSKKSRLKSTKSSTQWNTSIAFTSLQ